MTVREAYQLVIETHPGKVAVVCLDFPDFYAFGLKEQRKEKEPIGGGYTTVNKLSGELGGFVPTEDFEAFFAAKRIDIKTLNK